MAEVERYRQRISANGSIKNYVSFALEHLKDASKPPLVLHNLPAETAAPSSSMLTTDAIEKQCSLSLHKLISVVEIIKREYSKAVKADLHEGNTKRMTDETTSQKGGKRKRDAMTTLPVELHQYNQLVCLEDLGLMPQPSPDEIKLQIVSEGKTRRKHTTALLVTLSRMHLPEEAGKKDSFHQAPRALEHKPRKRKKKRKEIPQSKSGGGNETQEGFGELQGMQAD